jgi:acetylglutamate kinase
VMQAAQLGGKAIGVCGTDAHMLAARHLDERLGSVGEIVSVDPTLLLLLLQHGYLPVVAPLAFGAEGSCLNVNADLVAAHLAVALHAEYLLFLTDVDGIRHRDGSRMARLCETEARLFVQERVITDGMVPKVCAGLTALSAVSHVLLVDGRRPHILLRSLLDDATCGTRMVRDSERWDREEQR